MHQFNQSMPDLSVYNIDTYTRIVDGLRRIDEQITATQKGINEAEARLNANKAQVYAEEEKLNVVTTELQKTQSEVRYNIEEEVQNRQKELEEVKEKIKSIAQEIEVANDTISLTTQRAVTAREEVRNATSFLQINSTYESYNAVHSNNPVCALIDVSVAEPAQAIVAMRKKVAEIKK